LKERSGHVENCNQKLGVLLREEKHADFFLFFQKGVWRRQNDKAGAVSAVDSCNHSVVSFAIKLYDGQQHHQRPQAYPKVDTKLGSNEFYLECGKPESFGLYFATANRT
jgi:hypothetical protein